jgi:hypothetical protein
MNRDLDKVLLIMKNAIDIYVRIGYIPSHSVAFGIKYGKICTISTKLI